MPAHRVGHVVGVQAGRGHLVEQRLEGVEVVGVDERHVDRGVAERLGRRQAAEAGADDHDPMAVAHAAHGNRVVREGGRRRLTWPAPHRPLTPDRGTGRTVAP